jgi:hypothetical protein
LATPTVPVFPFKKIISLYWRGISTMLTNSNFNQSSSTLSDWHEGQTIRLPIPLNSLSQSRQRYLLVLSSFILMSAIGPPTVHITYHQSCYVSLSIFSFLDSDNSGKSIKNKKLVLKFWIHIYPIKSNINNN